MDFAGIGSDGRTDRRSRAGQTAQAAGKIGNRATCIDGDGDGDGDRVPAGRGGPDSTSGAAGKRQPAAQPRGSGGDFGVR